MQKINFQNLPNTTTPVNATNLNDLQDNVEDAIDGIIDSGSNANGNYIKYVDGTMICTGAYELPSGHKNFNKPYGSVYYTDLTETISFPMSFISVPNVVPSFYVQGGVGAGLTIRSAPTTSQFAVYPHYANSFNFESSTLKIYYIAIGRWK